MKRLLVALVLCVPSVSVCDRLFVGAGRPERRPDQVPASAAAVAW